jgi:hypothetical protein
VSCQVLIIPEDPTHDYATLEPLVQRILKDRGKGTAKVTVLRNPRVQGFHHACGMLPDICEQYSHFDLWLFLVDADGEDGSETFGHLESKHGRQLICCAALEEVEAWLLAGHIEKLDLPWREVRADVSVKENVFAPFLRQHGDSRRLGGGRDLLMRQTLTNYPGLLQRCPELKDLHDRVCASLASQN